MMTSMIVTTTIAGISATMTSTTTTASADHGTGAETAIETTALKYRLRPLRPFHSQAARHRR